MSSPDRSHQLRALVVGDGPSGWEAAGFHVTDGHVVIGSTTIILDPGAGSGITTAHLDGLTAPIDGLPIGVVPSPATRPRPHPNRVSGLDHLVAFSPAVQRTSDALDAAGLDLRRTRTFLVGDTTRRQDFFWMGDVILELVGVEGQAGPGPATFWGLALECDDLDAAAAHLGDSLGEVKDAVQEGRRIATVRTRDLGISTPIALLSPHEDGRSHTEPPAR